MWQCGAKLAVSSTRGRDRLRDPDRGHLVETGRKNGIGARVDRAPFFRAKRGRRRLCEKMLESFFNFILTGGDQYIIIKIYAYMHARISRAHDKGAQSYER